MDKIVGNPLEAMEIDILIILHPFLIPNKEGWKVLLSYRVDGNC